MFDLDETKEKTPTYIDPHGNKWYPKITTPVLIEGTCKCDIQLGALLAEDGNITVPIGSLIRLFWFACKHQAKMYGVKDESAFFEHIVPPSKIMEAVTALGAAIMASMPNVQLGDLESAKTEGPLGPG